MSITKYYIYVNAFFDGFQDKTDGINIDLFEKILKKTKLNNFEITNDVNKANVLLESFFGKTLKTYKVWYKKIFFSGESWSYDFNDYDIILKSSHTRYNIINFPLFAYYILNNNLLNTIINRPKILTIPPKFCCFCVSNGGCIPRNRMFEVINSYKKVDSIGKFNNNVGFYINKPYWDNDYINILKQYKFIICFENSKYDTYITEKIVNAQLSNSVPIYWGTNYVKNVFNINSFIYLENENINQSYIDVLNKVKELDNDDEKYLNFINQPVLNIDYFYENFSIDKIANKIDSLL
jgi:alpha(1,3/1,4) fucosyltransferase